MQVVVKHSFRDKNTGAICGLGDTLTIDEARYDEIVSKLGKDSLEIVGAKAPANKADAESATQPEGSVESKPAKGKSKAKTGAAVNAKTKKDPVDAE